MIQKKTKKIDMKLKVNEIIIDISESFKEIEESKKIKESNQN